MIDSFFRTSLKTCGRRRTWQIVHNPSFASATATPFRPLAVVSKMREDVAIDIGHELLALGGRPVDLGLQARHLGIEHGALGGNLFLGRLQLGLALLDAGVQLVGLHHDLENAILARADVVLRGLDLVEHRGVLAVGLHLEQLVLVFREPRLHAGDLFLLRPSLLAGRGEPRLDVGDARRARACSRASSAWMRAGWSAILRRASSAAVSSC